MLSQQVVFSFFGLSVLLALAPGPDNLFVLTLSALRGPRAGLWVVLGLCSGLVVHTAAVALGVAALFAASPLAFTALKFVGAAYLLYLAWGAWNTPALSGNGTALDSTPRLTPLQAWRRGLVMNLTNPKVVLFFLAFLPQFCSPAQGHLALQTLALGGLFIVAAGITFSSLALLAGSLGRKLQTSPRLHSWLQRGAGAVLAGLALKLALTTR
ncbi:LysE family translocator [Brachymonas sp. M4Q-1]|uniref:LysE family translocator n=1 Tax=Brachymonas sp. M4Q-1 TaxID=3416906 RepID=UPI003CF159E5